MTRLRVHWRLLLVCALGCSKPAEISGTNTNWLRACADASVCGGLGCSCGYCTPTCESDADCASVGGVCSLTESAILECQGAAFERLCLPRCTSSTQCEAGMLCYHGTCTHALAPTSCAAHPDALVCEDFEGGLDAYTPVVTSGNSATAVASATVSGVRALEANVLVAPSTAYLRATFSPVSTGSLALRGWIQVPAGQSSYDLAPLAFWSEAEPAWALRVVAKDGRLEAWSYTTPLSGNATLIAGEWHCVEATLDIADAGRVRIALDGTTIIDVSSIDTLPTGGIDALAMGAEWSGATAAVLVDRVAVGPTPLGCW